uniref:Uncharacterized protein n=1 Tax=Anguilla anguilla TaxID=7936 RepID=A0A0E9RMY9_ANGAN
MTDVHGALPDLLKSVLSHTKEIL